MEKIRYQMFYGDVDDVRIPIPTAHVYGREDMWRLHSMELLRLCDGASATVHEHDGGHEVTHGSADEVCDAIESVLARPLLKK